MSALSISSMSSATGSVAGCLAIADADTETSGVTFTSVFMSCPVSYRAANVARSTAAFTGGTNNLIGTSTMTAPAGATLTNQGLNFINGANETARPVVNAATVYPSFFTTTTYIGAVQNAADTWYTGWTCGLAAGSNC
jgi:hypothetical protein